jgi:LuxR family transcriptional regulator, maltose regulon positive regulatory protein
MLEAAEPYRGSGKPIPSGMSSYRSRGRLEVVLGGCDAACGGPRLVEHDPQKRSAVSAPVRDGPVPQAHLLWAVALLLEAIADDAPGDPDASALALERDLELAEADRVLFPALIRVAVGLLERRARHGFIEATLVAEIANLLGETKKSSLPSAGPLRPRESLTESETRVLRYLPTHMGAPEIAAELYLSPNTVKTHLQHLYRKLGAHSRREAVQRARAIGLLTASSRRP